MIKNRNLYYSLKLLVLYNRGGLKNTEKITQSYNLKSYNTLNKTYTSYGNNFIFKKNISTSSINNANEENSDDNDNDKLFLNEDSDDNEEDTDKGVEGTNTHKNNYNNKSTSTNLNNNIETKDIPTQIKKKSKYDSDKIIIYEDITELPSDICNVPLTDEEIEQINTGVSDYDFGDYASKIIHSKKKNK